MSTNLVSYELNGVKESFANWISNISPSDTPFTSMTNKETIQNKYFQWQEDSLGAVQTEAKPNAHAEGTEVGDEAIMNNTKVLSNVTQIVRKVVAVSDTANALSSYGRGTELQYQMEKAGKEIKRDIEWLLLNNKGSQDGMKPGEPSGNANIRKTAGFSHLVASLGEASNEDQNAIVHISAKTPGKLTEDDIFSVTQGLYLAGAKASHIMFHPKFAKVFSAMMEKGASRIRMFDGSVDTKVNAYVSTLVDPLGQRFTLLPNRFMPEDAIYVFNPSDWTQMVLRAPQTSQLGKTGNFDKYMIECELGLRHRNRFASGIIELGASSGGGSTTPTLNVTAVPTSGVVGTALTINGATSSDATSTVTYTVKTGSTNNTAGGTLTAGKYTATKAGKVVIVVAGDKGEASKEVTINFTAAPAQTPVSVAATGPGASSIYDASSKTATFSGLSDSLILTPTPASAIATLGGADAAKFQWTAGTKTVALKDDSASASATLTFSNSGNADLVVNLVFTKP